MFLISLREEIQLFLTFYFSPEEGCYLFSIIFIGFCFDLIHYNRQCVYVTLDTLKFVKYFIDCGCKSLELFQWNYIAMILFLFNIKCVIRAFAYFLLIDCLTASSIDFSHYVGYLKWWLYIMFLSFKRCLATIIIWRE